jgi:hypothetical protein
MEKPKYNPDFPTLPIMIFVLCSALLAIMVGIWDIPIVHEGLATGKICSVGIIINDTTMYYRDADPMAYWTMMGLFIFSGIGGFVLGTLGPILLIRAYIKKLARQKREKIVQL